MRAKTALVAVLVCLALAGGIVAVPLSARSASAGMGHPYRVGALEARLFYSDSGTFSENIVDNPRYQPLWNTVIGEGAAGGPSDALLVTVKVTGDPGSYEGGRRVRLKATSGKQTLLDKTLGVPILNEKGAAYVGFWVYDCTSQPLHLRAEILGQRSNAAIHRSIPFASGD